MSTRTDIHRPGVINGDDYRFVGVLYQGSSEDMAASYADEMDWLDAYPHVDTDASWTIEGNWATRGSCDLCGSRFAHGVAYRHVPTGRIMVVGHICAGSELLMDEATAAKHRAEKRLQAVKTERVNREYREAFATEHPEFLAFIEQVERDAEDEDAPDHLGISVDFAKQFRGSRPEFSDRQLETFPKLIAGRAKFLAAIRERAEREAAAGPRGEWELGRQQVTGRIFQIRTYENDFGSTTKMFVETDDRRVVLTTIPEALWRQANDNQDALRGSEVEFTVTIQDTGDEPHFGFGKRPAVKATDRGLVGAEDEDEDAEPEHTDHSDRRVCQGIGCVYGDH